jgi:CarD family transcriptional regulator
MGKDEPAPSSLSALSAACPGVGAYRFSRVDHATAGSGLGPGHARARTRKGRAVSYVVGDTVIYPNHGAAVIDAVETRQVKGEPRTYLVLRVVAEDGLVLRVPTSNLQVVGVRDAVDGEAMQTVLDTLRAEPPATDSTWSRRCRENTEKLRTGCVIRVAEVVRDLWRRERAGHLAAAEGRLLAKARQILVSELAHCHRTDRAKAEALLDEVLVG